MSLIRSEARKVLWRLREVLAGAALIALGLYWVVGMIGILSLVGYAVLALGAGLVALGVQRARFRTGADGPGVVQVDEGQITYFGPLSGGVVAIADLERLTLDQTSTPPHWVLDQRGQPPVFVPLNAAGAEALFDAYATLPGLRTERMLSELRRSTPHAVVIWERSPLRPVAARLH
jgi:ABC-type branched-subunit amino acid transport system permease subunit